MKLIALRNWCENGTLDPNYRRLLEWAIEHIEGLHAELNSRNYSDVVDSNVHTINSIHKKSMSLIKEIIDEANCVHPHYEDSYPKILKLVEDSRGNKR